MGGHMAHPIDYDELTREDLTDLVDSLFSGRIESMKEKLDGTNIQATMNDAGDVVFIRNKGDLNSENGGMSVQQMADKWKDKPSVAANYVKAGETISKIFAKIDKKRFNPDLSTRVIVNCECISAGKTNVMIYANDRVAFHGTITYKKGADGKWNIESESEGEPDWIRKAADGIESAKPRPDLIIKNYEQAQSYAKKAVRSLANILQKGETIEAYKKRRFMELAPKWARNEDCYKRLVLSDKSVNIRELKKSYPELQSFEKTGMSKLFKEIMQPLDSWLLSFGNEFISLLDGFTNAGAEDEVTDQLKKELAEVRKQTEESGSEQAREVLRQSVARLENLGNKINAAEGVVFQYKGRLMKITGAFAPLNQWLGVRFIDK